LHFSSKYDLSSDTLYNYFYKLAENLPLTDLEQQCYEIIGDVDVEYALKYITTFLLKYMKKEVVKSRIDIFVQVLEKYGYITAISEKEFTSNLPFEETIIPQVKCDSVKDFIQAQLLQRQWIKPYISIGS
jgi:repressor of nif and glnA expression